MNPKDSNPRGKNRLFWLRGSAPCASPAPRKVSLPVPVSPTSVPGKTVRLWLQLYLRLRLWPHLLLWLRIPDFGDVYQYCRFGRSQLFWHGTPWSFFWDNLISFPSAKISVRWAPGVWAASATAPVTTEPPATSRTAAASVSWAGGAPTAASGPASRTATGRTATESAPASPATHDCECREEITLSQLNKDKAYCSVAS